MSNRSFRCTLAVVASVVILMAPQLSAARGGGASPPQGRGPGAGYDYRRNVTQPGLGYPWAQMRARDELLRRERFRDGRGVPGRGIQEGWTRRDLPSVYAPARRGYGVGAPGWRGAGPSAYPRHRQYGNPPGLPR